VAFAFLLAFVLSVAAVIVHAVVFDFDAEYRSNHLSPAEELQLARDLCPSTSNGAVACDESEMEIALHYLDKIAPSASKYYEATKLRSLIQAFRPKAETARQQQEQAAAAERAKKQAEHDRLIHQSVEESQDQMRRNLAGQAHDLFTCSTSTDNLPTISFDYGHYWWADDGRCATQQEQAREAAEKAAQQAREQAEMAAQQKTVGRAKGTRLKRGTLQLLVHNHSCGH